MAVKKDDDDDDRIILLNEVDETPILTAIHSLFTLAQKDKKNPIYIVINTVGGSIYDMLALYDAIKYVQSLGITVNTVGLGKIMSAGVILLAAGNSRKIGKNATIMWHWGSDSVEGNIFEMKNEVNEFERLEHLCNDIFKEETKMTKEEMEELLNSKIDVYITPEKAIKLGIVDEYLETSKVEHPSAKPDNKTTKKKTSKKRKTK